MKTKNLKLLLTDVDGEKYYVTGTGDIVDRRGKLLPLAEEAQIRKSLQQDRALSLFPDAALIQENLIPI